MGSSVSRLLAVAVIGVSLASCSDSTSVSSPQPPVGAESSRRLFDSPTKVNVVTRDVPLDAAESATATVGFFGGRLELPGSGLRVIIPPFALTRPTEITVTAVAGRQVAYEFEPHGTQFNVPLIVTQSLAGTSAMTNGVLPSVLYAGYFPDVQSLDQVKATALVTELLGTSISTWKGSVSFLVTHFSGYLVATGERNPAEDVGAQ